MCNLFGLFMYAKKLKCDKPFCEWEGYIRTKCKNKESDFYRKYLCPYHAKEEGGSVKKSSKRIKTEKFNKEKSLDRSTYFDYHLDKCNKSEESGRPISNPTRLNICHILPKSHFPSVQSNIHNCIYLDGDEHTRIDRLIFSNRWEDIEKEFPNSWKLIKERLQLFINDVTENHGMLRSLKNYLGWI